MADVSAANVADHGSPSPHVKSPNGLQGWTLSYPFRDSPQEEYPRVLMIARNGHVIRHIRGGHYIWKWIFWNGGREVAYEDGPPHFLMNCILVDVKTGSMLENFDCFTGIPEKAPAWLRSLENDGP